MPSAALELSLDRSSALLEGVCHKDLAVAGSSHDSRGYVHRESAHFLAAHLALSDMETGSSLKSKPLDSVVDRPGTQQAGSRTLERGEESVPCGVDLMTTEPGQLAPHVGSILSQESAPALVPKFHRLLGGADDVGEEERQ